MKRDDDCDGDNGHVDAEAQPAEESALVGAVVAGVRGGVGEEEGGEEGRVEEGAGGGVAVWAELVGRFGEEEGGLETYESTVIAPVPHGSSQEAIVSANDRIGC